MKALLLGGSSHRLRPGWVRALAPSGFLDELQTVFTHDTLTPGDNVNVGSTVLKESQMHV